MLRSWQLFSNDLIPGLFRLIMAFFRRLLDDVERLLYTVDEWLRFRSGDSRGSLVVKAVLGLFWFFVTYVVRFCVNLLVEPQINPIKHFPVVTVSHKLVLTFVMPALTVILWSTGMNPFLAGCLAFVVQISLPGIPGFLVWEFKENWRLYRANQSPILQPQIGRRPRRNRSRGCCGPASIRARCRSCTPGCGASRTPARASGTRNCITSRRRCAVSWCATC